MSCSRARPCFDVYFELSILKKFYLALRRPIGGFTALHEVLFLRLQLDPIDIWIGNIFYMHATILDLNTKRNCELRAHCLLIFSG